MVIIHPSVRAGINEQKPHRQSMTETQNLTEQKARLAALDKMVPGRLQAQVIQKASLRKPQE